MFTPTMFSRGRLLQVSSSREGLRKHEVPLRAVLRELAAEVALAYQEGVDSAVVVQVRHHGFGVGPPLEVARPAGELLSRQRLLEAEVPGLQVVIYFGYTQFA